MGAPSSLFRKAVYTELRGIAQRVATRARVYALGALPAKGHPDLYVTWSRVSKVSHRHLKGGAELVEDRYDVNCWAQKLSDAEGLADAMEDALDNRTGSIGDATDRAEFSAVFLEDSAHSFTAPRDASASGWHRIRMDFLFWHKRTATPVGQ